MKLTARLLLIIVLAALPVLALQVYEHSQEREARKTQIADQAFQMARQAAAEQDQFIEGARYLLAAASQLREVQERDGPACSARMTELRRQVPNVAGLGVVDPDGVRFCGSEPDAQRIEVSDRPYFQAALQDKRLAISGFIIGRRSGKPHLNFAYPAVDDAGEVRAVLILAFGLEQLSGQLAASPLPPGAMISLVDSAGRLLARAPPAPERIGEWVRDDSFSKLMLTLRAGVVEGTGVDGVERVYGFAPLFASADLFAVVGLPLRHTYAAADRLSGGRSRSRRSPFWPRRCSPGSGPSSGSADRSPRCSEWSGACRQAISARARSAAGTARRSSRAWPAASMPWPRRCRAGRPSCRRARSVCARWSRQPPTASSWPTSVA